MQLGLGNASIKYVSQYLANREEAKIAKTFWSCLFAYIFLGLLGSVVVASSAHVLVEKFFKIPDELKIISVSALRLSSVGFLISIIRFWGRQILYR